MTAAGRGRTTPSCPRQKPTASPVAPQAQETNQRTAAEAKSRDSLSPGNHVENTGVRKMPKSVTPSMPLKTAMPSERRISAPAPEATISGITPKMKASEVMRIGRSRKREASWVAAVRALALAVQLLGVFDDEDGILAGQRDEHDQADLHENVDVAAITRTPVTEQSRHSGTTRMTAAGSHQLS